MNIIEAMQITIKAGTVNPDTTEPDKNWLWFDAHPRAGVTLNTTARDLKLDVEDLQRLRAFLNHLLDDPAVSHESLREDPLFAARV